MTTDFIRFRTWLGCSADWCVRSDSLCSDWSIQACLSLIGWTGLKKQAACTGPQVREAGTFELWSQQLGRSYRGVSVRYSIPFQAWSHHCLWVNLTRVVGLNVFVLLVSVKYRSNIGVETSTMPWPINSPFKSDKFWREDPSNTL